MLRAVVLAGVLVGAGGCRAADPDPVILALGDQQVRRSELDRYVAALEVRGGGALSPEVRRQVRQAFLEERVLVLEARARGLVQPGARPEEERRAVLSLVAERARSAGAVDEAAVERYYQEHAAEFEEPERLAVRQVLVATENEAREVKRQVEKDAKQFDLLARTRSRSPEAAQGGFMGRFARGELPTELEAAVFSLPVGQVSDVVQSSHGYHVLRVDERRAAQKRPLEECRDEIRARLRSARQDEATRDFVRELLARAKVEDEAADDGRSRP
jgi:parvulin-like peptidyl-prolyl isomerase